MRAGRSLDALLSAYRLGARLAWERFVAAGEAAGHEPRTLYRLASAIFDYIDGISAESVEGFTEERAAAEGERQRRRRALARLLARDDVAAEEVRDLARLAGWARPADARRRSSSATAPATSPTPTAWPRGWAAARSPPPRARWPSPGSPIPRRRAAAPSSSPRSTACPAALGPTVVPERAPLSLARARAAHALVLDGRVGGGPLVVADEHLPALLLHAGDGALATDLAARALAPLDDLRPGARGRLRTTLRAWLDHPGQVTRVAGELHVHPQTVRYRVAQLRELFGERLEDADARFELALALRAEPPA